MTRAYRFGASDTAGNANAASEAVTKPRSGMFEAFPDLLTPQDAARALHISPQAVNNLCRAGRLPHVQISERRRLIPKPALIEWIEGGGNVGK